MAKEREYESLYSTVDAAMKASPGARPHQVMLDLVNVMLGKAKRQFRDAVALKSIPEQIDKDAPYDALLAAAHAMKQAEAQFLNAERAERRTAARNFDAD